MTSRERLRIALDHREPDRVPIDLGSNLQSGIMAHALDRLRRYLGLPRRTVKVHEVFQMLGEVEPDVVERLGADILPVEPLVQFFGLERKDWKPWRMWDGTAILVPGRFEVETDVDGGWLLRAGGDPRGRWKAGCRRAASILTCQPSRRASTGGSLHRSARSAKSTSSAPRNWSTCRPAQRTFAPPPTRRSCSVPGMQPACPGWEASRISSCSSQRTVHMPGTSSPCGRRWRWKISERLQAHLGDSIDVIGMEGTDYAGQDRELISPELFEELCVPFFRIQNAWVHEHTSWKTWYHCCGSIPRLLPFLIDAGVDIINPVQTSAAGMDPRLLKDRFGDRIVFWGGGIDTQRTLPFAPPEKVAAEVRERIRIFAPGGGFVFNPIHNIQQGTPPGNIAAAYDAARSAGTYPVS